MHLRSTLCAFAVAVLLAGHYFAFERPLPVEDEIAREPLVTLAVEAITRLEITRDGAPIVLVREPGASRWRLGDAGGAEVDQQLVYAIYRALHEHTVLASWEGPTADFGLDAYALRVTLSDSARSEWLGFGAKDPSGQRRYVQRGEGSAPAGTPGRARIGLAARTAADAFDHSETEWRDRRLVGRDDAERDVRRIEVQRGELSYALVLDQDRWRLDPGGERVRREVDGQIATLMGARHDGTRPARELAGDTRITIAWVDGPAQILELGALEDERGYWVWEPGAPTQHFVARSHLAWLLAGPDEMRTLEVIAGKAGAQYLRRIAVTSPGQPPVVAVQDGTRTLVLDPPGALEGFTSHAAKRVALALDGAKILGRISGAPTAEELEALGLTVPVASYTVLRQWSERGRDREATTVLELGIEGEGGVAVRIDGTSAVYLIDAAIGRLLRGGPLGFRTGRLLAGLELTTVSALRFADRREPSATKTYTLLRKGERWYAGDVEIAAQSVREVFARLEAMEVEHYLPQGSPPGAPAPYEIQLDLADGRVTLALEMLGGDQVQVRYTRNGITLPGIATRSHAQAIAALVGALAAQATPPR